MPGADERRGRSTEGCDGEGRRRAAHADPPLHAIHVGAPRRAL